MGFELTFVTVPNGVEIDVVGGRGLSSEEEQAEPRLERVDGNNKQDADDPALLSWIGVKPQVLVDLVAGDGDSCPNHFCQSKSHC